MGGKNAGGGFLGIGGESGFLNTGLFGTGQKLKSSFDVSPQALQYEKQMLDRQNAIASGQAPSYAQMAMNQNMDATGRQAAAMAASQRGASNPMLAFRQAQMGNQQAQLEGAQQAALMAEQEKRQADQMIAAQVASQRGVALNADQANLNAKMQGQKNNTDAIVGMGQTAGKMAAAAHGAVVPGTANVPGDSVLNDTQPYMLSPGEVVVPRSAAKNEKTLKMFVEKIKLEEKLSKAGC